MSFEKYLEQMKLLIRVLPFVLKDKRFALKGGTAINLFYRDLPRISIDIDIVYLPLENRQVSFKNIHGILQNIKNDLTKLPEFSKMQIIASNPLDGEMETKLIIKMDGNEVKIEPNYILRGVVGKTIDKDICNKVSELTSLGTNVRCVSLEDLYGGKICAALDRQHPRDLFDVKILFDNEGLTQGIKNAFIFYLVSSNRPMIEILKPNLLSIDRSYIEEFKGMYNGDIKILELEKTREKLISDINKALTNNDKKFLISIADGNPDWAIAPLKNMEDYPSVKWKLLNIEKMSNKKKKDNLLKLKEHFC